MLRLQEHLQPAVTGTRMAKEAFPRTQRPRDVSEMSRRPHRLRARRLSASAVRLHHGPLGHHRQLQRPPVPGERPLVAPEGAGGDRRRRSSWWTTPPMTGAWRWSREKFPRGPPDRLQGRMSDSRGRTTPRSGTADGPAPPAHQPRYHRSGRYLPGDGRVPRCPPGCRPRGVQDPESRRIVPARLPAELPDALGRVHEDHRAERALSRGRAGSAGTT